MSDAEQRTRLPNRRRNITSEVSWNGFKYTVTCGFRADGTVAEIFIDGHKEGSEIERALDEQAILISYALQGHVAISELARRSDDTAIGAVIRRAAELEHEYGPDMRLASLQQEAAR